MLDADSKAVRAELQSLHDARVIQDAVSRGEVAEILRGGVATRKRYQ
jgi:hypothetical protein